VGTEQETDMKFLLVLALAASSRGDATADPAFFYSTGGVPAPLAPIAYAHAPLTYTAPILLGGCQNAQGSPVPCNVAGAAVAPLAVPAAAAAPEEGGVEVSKREAGAEPTAEADPEADPWYYYSSYAHPYSYGYTYSYGHPYSYGYTYSPLAYSYYGHHYPYYGYYGRKKREAEAEPEADPEADPWYYYSGYAPYTYAYAAPYTYGAYYHAPLTYVLGGCRNYLGSVVPCAGK